MIKKYYVDSNSIDSIPFNVSCIGNFDGVHLGHQALISKTVELANSLKVLPFVITFDKDPIDVISSKKEKHITTLNKRIKLFEKFGIKGVVIVKFDQDLMNLQTKEFSDDYLKKFNIKSLVCGFDFHYGKFGKGNYKTLEKELKGYCDVFVVDEVKYYSKKISSSRIKKEIEKKNYKLVNRMLGYEYKR